MKGIYGISTVHVGGTPQKTTKKPVHEENFISITIEEKHQTDSQKFFKEKKLVNDIYMVSGHGQMTLGELFKEENVEFGQS